MSATTKNEPPGLQLFWKLYRENRQKLAEKSLERARASKLALAMQLTVDLNVEGNC